MKITNPTLGAVILLKLLLLGFMALVNWLIPTP
jgi:hypothetical protein